MKKRRGKMSVAFEKHQLFAQSFREHNHWLDRTAGSFLRVSAREFPDKVALVENRAGREQSQRITYRELLVMVEQVAISLVRLGVVRGDVVTIQLPNWSEFVTVAMACDRIGAVFNPVSPILRERELAFILNICSSKIFIVPSRYKGFNYSAMAESLRAELPSLLHLIVVGGVSENEFGKMLLSPYLDDKDLEAGGSLLPDDIALLMFTSGTTGEPKGVLHTSNALIASAKSLADRGSLSADDVAFVASPVSHITAYVGLVMVSLYLGATLVFQDIWEPRLGVALMSQEGATYAVASPVFLSDICEVVEAGQPAPAKLRMFLCGGAPVPPVLVQRAAQTLDADVCSCFGMTEILAGTLTEPARAAEKSSMTDGRAMDGMEAQILDDNNNVPRSGESGRLLFRGAHMFAGYFKKPELVPLDEDGWFDSGDLAYMDDDGYIRVTGRVKDVIIRGGENVPVVEIENLLYKHPGVSEVAIVGDPDTRFGERACAFIVAKDDCEINLAVVQTYLAECRVAKQFWPERVEVVTTMPRTASGKVQKFKLKQLALLTTT